MFLSYLGITCVHELSGALNLHSLRMRVRNNIDMSWGITDEAMRYLQHVRMTKTLYSPKGFRSFYGP